VLREAKWWLLRVTHRVCRKWACLRNDKGSAGALAVRQRCVLTQQTAFAADSGTQSVLGVDLS
jgi:hypothetical protein